MSASCRASDAPRQAPLNVLILAGTSEATALAQALAGKPGIIVSMSLAGRTQTPAPPPLPTRIGGFGGVDGLVAYLMRERVDVLVDATHPFAAQISQNAQAAADRAGCPLLVVGRPPWRPRTGDDWREVADVQAAVDALGSAPRRVFLTIGRLQLAAFADAPQHFFLVRTIERADAALLPRARWITARGPFDTAAEAALMRTHRIEVLVTKNSGGVATAGKLEAARQLGLPVILVRRPSVAQGALGVEGALAAIEAHRAGARRGLQGRVGSTRQELGDGHARSGEVEIAADRHVACAPVAHQIVAPIASDEDDR